MMTDNLRTRIAKALHQMYHLSLDDVSWDDEPHMVQDDYLRDADAVTHVLGLTLTWATRTEGGTVYRYVTDWELDE